MPLVVCPPEARAAKLFTGIPEQFLVSVRGVAIDESDAVCAAFGRDVQAHAHVESGDDILRWAKKGAAILTLTI